MIIKATEMYVHHRTAKLEYNEPGHSEFTAYITNLNSRFRENCCI